MVIRPYKVNEQPKILHKISENALYKQYLTENQTSLKKMKMESQAYRDLLIFHEYGEYRKYLVELSKLMGDDSIVNIPLEIYSYLGYVRSVVQKNQTGQMNFTSLAPKVEIDSFLESLKLFYEKLKEIDYLDLSHVKGEDLSYGEYVEIFNPENILINKSNIKENMAHINNEILKSIYSVDKISKCDDDIKEILYYTLNGEIGADELLRQISILESERRGKTKYLKHINGYIK